MTPYSFLRQDNTNQTITDSVLPGDDLALTLNKKQIMEKEGTKQLQYSNGAFDGAEVSEIMGLHILYLIAIKHKVIPLERLGLYRDDFLGIGTGGGPSIERQKKKIIKIFKDHGFKLTMEANTRRVHFLDFLHFNKYCWTFVSFNFITFS